MSMLLAAACANGVSTINNADQIERGYERIDQRLNALGARITRVPARSGESE
jgi:UDP-N-acetylglucosamine 1-carboxyvinyltransferase